jgi:uncharacterized SAM-dependent methyltransferase
MVLRSYGLLATIVQQVRVVSLGSGASQKVAKIDAADGSLVGFVSFDAGQGLSCRATARLLVQPD